jgi:hypothetical protein
MAVTGEGVMKHIGTESLLQEAFAQHCFPCTRSGTRFWKHLNWKVTVVTSWHIGIRYQHFTSANSDFTWKLIKTGLQIYSIELEVIDLSALIGTTDGYKQAFAKGTIVLQT